MGHPITTPNPTSIPNDEQIVGKCGNCGGIVTVPRVYWSVNRPVPTCRQCGAQVDETAHLPTLPMR